jgi:hypothetical protein
MSDFGEMAILIGGIAGLALLYWAVRIWRGRRFVRHWAREQGWVLIRSKWCWDGGPFSLLGGVALSAPFDVYQVTVTREGGDKRVAYVKCGTWLGLGLTPMVLFEARWKSEPGVVQKDRLI